MYKLIIVSLACASLIGCTTAPPRQQYAPMQGPPTSDQAPQWRQSSRQSSGSFCQRHTWACWVGGVLVLGGMYRLGNPPVHWEKGEGSTDSKPTCSYTGASAFTCP